MQLQHKALVAVLAAMFDIDDPNLVAFKGRMQHMQRLGFPPGSNTGRGKPSTYGWRELFLLSMAFQFLEIGATPDRTIAYLTKAEEPLLVALRNVVKSVLEGKKAGDFENFLKVELSGLQSLQTNREEREQFCVLPHDKIKALFASEGGTISQSRYTFIDLAHVVSIALDEIGNLLPNDQDDNVKSLLDWSAPNSAELLRLRMA